VRVVQVVIAAIVVTTGLAACQTTDQVSGSPLSSPNAPSTSLSPSSAASDGSPSAVWLPDWAEDTTPAVVAARRPLPFCGVERAPRPQPGIFVDASVRSCFWDAYNAGREAEFASVQSTMEGAPIAMVYRLLADGSVEVLTDWSQDPFGAAPGWTISTCAGLVEAAEGNELFSVDGCDEGAPID
jgi:hypothetical protein